MPLAGSAAPAFSIPVVANGQGQITLAKLSGRAVLLNFFASWCIPCKAEVPTIAQLSKIYSKRGVVVIGIDELESPQAASSFAAQFKLPYAIGLDNSGAVGGAYGLIGLPLSIFIDASGKIASRHAGQMSETELRAGLEQIARR